MCFDRLISARWIIGPRGTLSMVPGGHTTSARVQAAPRCEISSAYVSDLNSGAEGIQW